MGDNRSDSNPPVVSNLNPGLDPKAARTVSDFSDAWSGLMEFGGLCRQQLSRGWNYATANAGRRYATAGFGFILLVAIAAVSMMGDEKVTPQPPQVVAAGPDVRVAKLGDGWISIAEANGIADWHTLVDANMGLVRVNTAWCNARPTGANYRAGLQIDGQPRDDDFCVLFPYKGEMLAITTLRIGQPYNLPPVSAVANNVN